MQEVAVSLKRIIALALVLVVAIAISTAMISTPETNISYKTSSTETRIFAKDPIDDPGPPGRTTGAESQIL